MNFDKQARKLATEERMPVRPTWRYMDLVELQQRIQDAELDGELCDIVLNELWKLEDLPTHRTHVNGQADCFVAWCRCDWVSPRFDTFAEADRAAVEHFNEGRRHA